MRKVLRTQIHVKLMNFTIHENHPFLSIKTNTISPNETIFLLSFFKINAIKFWFWIMLLNVIRKVQVSLKIQVADFKIHMWLNFKNSLIYNLRKWQFNKNCHKCLSMNNNTALTSIGIRDNLFWSQTQVNIACEHQFRLV